MQRDSNRFIVDNYMNYFFMFVICIILLNVFQNIPNLNFILVGFVLSCFGIWGLEIFYAMVYKKQRELYIRSRVNNASEKLLKQQNQKNYKAFLRYELEKLLRE